jgi:opacity protein-like surface antigen
MSKYLNSATAAILVLLTSYAQAADIINSQSAAPVMTTIPLEVEVGSRYWLSNGSYVGNLYDAVTPGQMNSRLTYNNMTGHSAEVFFRLEHETGIFAKGFIGGGTLASGKMNDEDFPPAISPYSNTIQVQSGGQIKYLTFDVGYEVLRGYAINGLPFRIGPFVGYNNYHERFNTFGCGQVASNPNVCGQAFPTTFDGLDENTSWNSLRVGLGGEVTLLPGVRASLEGAWLRNWYYGTDYHNFKTEMRGTSETGSGQGAQVEGILSLDLTPRFSLGIGGRYWVFNAASKAHWEQLPLALYSFASSSPLGVYSQRYGGFLQAAYRFGGENDKDRGNLLTNNFGKSEDAPHNWGGVYLGGNVGYGFGNSGVTTLSPLSNKAAEYQGSLYTPTTVRSDNAGFSGGGQLGFNLKLSEPIIVGAETDISYANIGGSIGTASNAIYSYVDENILYTRNVPSYLTSKTQLQWFGTVRARAGYLVRDDALLYGTAGLAYGGINARGVTMNTEFTYDYGNAAYGQYNDTAIGWAAGAGIEYAVSKNFSLKTEWLYLGFGNQTYALNPITNSGPIGYSLSVNNNTQLIRTGLNYKIIFD